MTMKDAAWQHRPDVEQAEFQHDPAPTRKQERPITPADLKDAAAVLAVLLLLIGLMRLVW